MPHLFAYGSLMCPEIMERVAGLRAASRPATLYHFQRSRLHHLEYPGIFPRPHAHVDGILYLDLTPSALQRLDDFEGEQYVRQEVTVILTDSTIQTAMTYVLHGHGRDLITDEEWDFATFLVSGKKRFLKSYFGFSHLPDNPESHG